MQYDAVYNRLSKSAWTNAINSTPAKIHKLN